MRYQVCLFSIAEVDEETFLWTVWNFCNHVRQVQGVLRSLESLKEGYFGRSGISKELFESSSNNEFKNVVPTRQPKYLPSQESLQNGASSSVNSRIRRGGVESQGDYLVC